MIQTNVRTSNGMNALSTTNKACVDLFFSIGAMRNSSDAEIISRFQNAFDENRDIALRIVMYSRDILQGQGERKTNQVIFKHLATVHPEILRPNLRLIPELGYWKDLLIFFNTVLEDTVLELIKTGLNEKNGLCAKWMPRKGDVANKIRKHLNLDPKSYRKLLVSLTNVVETQMCSKDWNNIEYKKVPSRASKNYRKAFKKNDEIRYTEFLARVEKGEEKINAKALHPHEILDPYIKNFNGPIDATLEALWRALPNFLSGVNSILPVCDVSGSMGMYGGLPMQVCVSLGMYIAERNEGPFKNAFVTFSDNPKIHVLKENSLRANVRNMMGAEWGGSTNIQKTFELLLQTGIRSNLSNDQMPKMILIFSDMEFNACSKNHDASVFSMLKQMYETAGYTMPTLVFWNIKDSGKHFPVSYDTNNVALVSGFSPSIMKQLLAAEIVSPESMMMQTISVDRYKVIV